MLLMTFLWSQSFGWQAIPLLDAWQAKKGGSLRDWIEIPLWQSHYDGWANLSLHLIFGDESFRAKLANSDKN